MKMLGWIECHKSRNFRSNLFELSDAVSIDVRQISNFRRIFRQYGRKALFLVTVQICIRAAEFSWIRIDQQACVSMNFSKYYRRVRINVETFEVYI
jgi:hypothetical protein